MRKPHISLYGIPINEIARILGCSLKTAGRYKAGQSVPRLCELQILERNLGCFAAEWRGWTIRDDALISPEGWSITVNDVLAAPLLRAQLATYQAELRKIREAVDELDEQPDSWDEDAIKRFIA